MCKKKRFCNDNYTIVCKSNYANIFITFHINQKRSTASTYHNFCSLLSFHNLHWRKIRCPNIFNIKYVFLSDTVFRLLYKIFQTGSFRYYLVNEATHCYQFTDNIIWHDNDVRAYSFKNAIHFYFYLFLFVTSFLFLFVKIELVKLGWLSTNVWIMIDF